MPVVEVDPRWIDEMKSIGDIKLDNLSAVVDDALRQHLFHLRQKKIDREWRFYEANHAALFAEYAGKYIAIHNGEVVGADEDGRALSRQMRQQLGRTPIAIIQVLKTPEPPTFTVRRPRVSRT